MRTLYRLLRAGLHGVLLFVLPWITGALLGLLVDVREVEETGGRFATLFAAIVLPLAILQLVAVTVKVRREIRARRADGGRGFGVVVDALDRHVRVLTGRGIGMAVASMAMVALALSAKWGQFGVLAASGLGVIYLASTAATLASAFGVGAFDDRLTRRRGTIGREMSPTIVDAGDPVEERFTLGRVPVLPGYRLHIEEGLPARLGGDTRFALDRTVTRGEVTVAAPLPRTPRGVYRLGPADIWFEDVLGLTRVFVASRATAQLRALPRLAPLLFAREARARRKAEGPLSVLSRMATEEHFRTRSYVPGDDLRRVHWKQSVNTGQLVVRVPESVPFAPSRVRLVLDTYLPPHLRIAANTGGRAPAGHAVRAPDALEDVLDLLVEAWIALAVALQKRGEHVSLVTAVRDESGGVTVKEMPGRRGEERRWRALGSDCAWQTELALDHVARDGATRAGEPPAGLVVVTAGLARAEALASPSSTVVLADAASVVAEPPPARSLAERALFFDYPVGADDNRFDFARFVAPKPPPAASVRDDLARATASAAALARGRVASLLVVRRRGVHLALEVP